MPSARFEEGEASTDTAGSTSCLFMMGIETRWALSVCSLGESGQAQRRFVWGTCATPFAAGKNKDVLGGPIRSLSTVCTGGARLGAGAQQP